MIYKSLMAAHTRELVSLHTQTQNKVARQGHKGHCYTGVSRHLYHLYWKSIYLITSLIHTQAHTAGIMKSMCLPVFISLMAVQLDLMTLISFLYAVDKSWCTHLNFTFLALYCSHWGEITENVTALKADQSKDYNNSAGTSGASLHQV